MNLIPLSKDKLKNLGKTRTYLIESGYAHNIFHGDIVVIKPDGTITNLTKHTNFQTPLLLGMFDACSFQTTSESTHRSYWPAGTITLNNLPAIAQIIQEK